MMRPFFRNADLLILSLLLSVLTGCVSSAAGQPEWLRWGDASSQNTSAAAESTPLLSEPSAVAERTAGDPRGNPFQVEQASSATSAQPPRAQHATDHTSSTPPFDGATLMLIETEFQDASPAERERWFRELRQVPPEMVPQILRMRRLAQQAIEPKAELPRVAASSPTPSAANTDTSAAAPVRPTASVTSSATAQPLNSAVPWSPPSPPVRTAAADIAAPTDSPNSSQSSTVPQLVSYETATANAAGDILANGSASSFTPDGNASYEQTLEQMIAMAEQQVAELQPGEREEERLHYAAKHAYLRMLYLMADRQERALEAIPHLPPAEQEFWQQMFWATASYFDSSGIPNPSDRATHTVSQLTEATDRLRERANLELRNLAFCEKIDGFGLYDRFERDEFRPGQPVLLYAEMRNFLAEPTSDGRYRTILKSTIEIHRVGGQAGLVSRQDFAPTEDVCRNRRHDYFHSYLINIPERVTVGPHVLKLIVEDQLNRKVATYSINFTVN